MSPGYASLGQHITINFGAALSDHLFQKTGIYRTPKEVEQRYNDFELIIGHNFGEFYIWAIYLYPYNPGTYDVVTWLLERMQKSDISIDKIQHEIYFQSLFQHRSERLGYWAINNQSIPDSVLEITRQVSNRSRSNSSCIHHVCQSYLLPCILYSLYITNLLGSYL